MSDRLGIGNSSFCLGGTKRHSHSLIIIFLRERFTPRDRYLQGFALNINIYLCHAADYDGHTKSALKGKRTDTNRGARPTINGQRSAARKSGFPFTSRLYSITFSLITQFLSPLSGAFPSFLPHCLLHSLPFRPELPTYIALAPRSAVYMKTKPDPLRPAETRLNFRFNWVMRGPKYSPTFFCASGVI